MAEDLRGWVYYRKADHYWQIVLRNAKLNRLTILLCPAKACDGLLCLAMAIQTVRGVCQRTAMYSLVNEVCCLMIPLMQSD